MSVSSHPCQNKLYHHSSDEHDQQQQATINKNNQRLVLTPSSTQTPSAIRSRFKVIPRTGPVDEEDPYGPMSGNFYPGSRQHRSTTPGSGVNVLCDINNATVTSEPEHYCAYHPTTPGGTTVVPVSSVSHLDLRRSGATSQAGVPIREVHTAPGRRFISNTMH